MLHQIICQSASGSKGAFRHQSSWSCDWSSSSVGRTSRRAFFLVKSDRTSGGFHTRSSVACAPNCKQPASAAGALLVQVRRASTADAACMGDIERLCAGFWTASELESELEEERTLLLVAEEAKPASRIVGLVLLWLIADEAQILEMAVHPAVQRRGIGLQLLTEALRISTKHIKEKAGRGAAVLEVGVQNTAAIALYDRLGFKTVGRRERYYPDGSDAFLMRLPIH